MKTGAQSLDATVSSNKTVPLFEPVDLYRKKSGGELLGQLFDFTDKGEREVTLRPEMTPTVARMVAAKARELRKPIKWFSIASFFRFERQQRGRFREFCQLNCDLIGEASSSADAELIAFAIDLFRSFGLTPHDFVVRINDRQVWYHFLESVGLQNRSEELAPKLLTIIDKLEREPEDVTREKLASIGIDLSAVHEFLKRPASQLGGALGALEADLRARGLSDYVHFDPKIVRGLAYYTGVVFEVFDRKKKLRALAGGGRYNDLIAKLSDGVTDLPAIGFAIGDVTLLELLRIVPHAAERLEKAIQIAGAPQIYAVIADEAFRPQAVNTIQLLREAGYSVDFPLTAQKVGKQFQVAEQLGATFAVVFGSEWPLVKLKLLAERTEISVYGSELIQHIRTLGEPTPNA